MVCFLVVIFSATTAHASFSFDDFEFWVGNGANRSALVIDWTENSSEPPALAWGYRWDGTATGRAMLTAIVAADPRLFAKLGDNAADPVAVYGLGYDADNDGDFGIDDGSQFDVAGLTFSGPADLATATDAGDYYAEGWFTGFWHFGVEEPSSANPYDGGGWTDIGAGMAGRELVDGAWDSWVYSPTFDFASFAENPLAAPSPFPPGDFNRDRQVTAIDYDVWRATFGSITHPAADANRNGIIDAADYVVWRNHAADAATQLSASSAKVPEPATITLFLFCLTLSQFVIRPVRRCPQMNADSRALSANICG
jgi:hypothetical protein